MDFPSISANGPPDRLSLAGLSLWYLAASVAPVTLQTPKRTTAARCSACGHYAAIHDVLGKAAKDYDEDGDPIYEEVTWAGCNACRCEKTREWAYRWAV